MNDEMQSRPLVLAAGMADLSQDKGSSSRANDPMGGVDMQNVPLSRRSGAGPGIRFNESALRAVLHQGFGGFTPVIINVAPVDLPSLFPVQPPAAKR